MKYVFFCCCYRCCHWTKIIMNRRKLRAKKVAFLAHFSSIHFLCHSQSEVKRGRRQRSQKSVTIQWGESYFEFALRCVAFSMSRRRRFFFKYEIINNQQNENEYQKRKQIQCGNTQHQCTCRTFSVFKIYEIKRLNTAHSHSLIHLMLEYGRNYQSNIPSFIK